MRNIFQFCLYISCLVTIKEKSNAKLFSTIMSIEFCPNCNQTADEYANLKNISHFSKYLILFLLGIYDLADKGICHFFIVQVHHD